MKSSHFDAEADALAAAYKEWFTRRFKNAQGKPNMTAWHFFAYITQGDLDATSAAIRRFRSYCSLARKQSSWRNAAAWWVLHGRRDSKEVRK